MLNGRLSRQIDLIVGPCMIFDGDSEVEYKKTERRKYLKHILQGKILD
jgi:hypothetical protein